MVTQRAKAPRPTAVLPAVETLLKSLELNEEGNARAAIARALASKLDEAALSDSGTIAMATAGIAKELRAVLDEILAATGDDALFVHDLFAPVGNSQN